MAKIVGFGQTGFVARMQKASLFGYERAGSIEREFSPYAGALGAGSVFVTDADYKRLDADELAAYNSVQQYRGVYAVQAMMERLDAQHAAYLNSPSDWQSLRAQYDAIVATAEEIKRAIATGGGQGVPPPPRAMAESCTQQLIWDGAQWYCPDSPKPPPPVTPVTPGGGAAQWSDPLAGQVAALAAQRVRGPNDTYRAFQRREGISADGIYGPQTAAALAKYGSPVPPPVAGGGGGGVAPAACPAGTTGTPPNCVTMVAACPEGMVGTPPNCKPKGTLANIIIGATLVTAAVGMLALVARQREE